MLKCNYLTDRNITWPNNRNCPIGIQNLMHDIWIKQFYSTKQHWNERRGVCLKYFVDDCSHVSRRWSNL
jgi:hypothetical protein